jgi:hypothetical protein
MKKNLLKKQILAAILYHRGFSWSSGLSGQSSGLSARSSGTLDECSGTFSIRWDFGANVREL